MQASSTRQNRRGNYAVMFGVAVIPMLGGAALAVDLGMQRVVDAQNQAAVDAAAHAASLYLDGTEEGLAAARSAAAHAISKNHVAGTSVEIDMDGGAGPNRLVFGELEDGVFVESDDAEFINAVQVSYAFDDLATPLASAAFGVDSVGVSSCSIAQRMPTDAGAVGCVIPLAVPLCVVENFSDDDIIEMTFVLNPAGVDNVGWAMPGDSVGSSLVDAQLADCEYSGDVQVGESIQLKNGVATSSLKTLADVIEMSPDTWDAETFGALPEQDAKSGVAASAYGQVLTGSIIVFDGGDAYCEAGTGSFNGSDTIVGFAPAAVFDVVSKGSAENKNIKLKLDSKNQYDWGIKPGGQGMGVEYVQHAIVDEECQAG